MRLVGFANLRTITSKLNLNNWGWLNVSGWPPIFVWAPATVVAIGLALPIVYLLVRALGAGEEAWDLLFRQSVLDTSLRTLKLVGAVSAACIVLAVPLAWLTVRADLPWRQAWAVILSLPLVVPSYVAAFTLVVALGPRGMLQGWLEGPLGIQRLPGIYGFYGAMATLTFLSYPYVFLTVRAALWRLDPSLEESSRVMGNTPLTTFRRVTLPLLRPAIAAGGLLVALYTLSDFGAVSLLRYQTFTWSIFIQYESAIDRTAGAVLSLALVALALGIVAAESLTRGRARYYRSAGGAERPPPIVHLGRWKWPAVVLCALVALVSLILPVSVLVYWVVRGVSAGEPLLILWSAARNSLYAAGLAALATTVAALPLAILSVRYPGILSSLLERVSYVGFALPGIVIALALVFFGANYLPRLYQTLGMLIMAYVILFLPTAVGAIRASLQQVSPHMEDAARSLGRSPWRVFASVTFPLVRPGILSGAALVFLLTMKELPATLVLSPIGFKTLASSIWSAASEAFFARAAAPALLLILVSSVPLAFLMLRDRR